VVGNWLTWSAACLAVVTGDRIGVLLDLGAGWMRLYRNGKRCGPGFTAGA
jgi:hypothetical protein